MRRLGRPCAWRVAPVLAAAGVLLACAAPAGEGAGPAARPAPFEGADVGVRLERFDFGGGFTLTGHTGARVSLDDYRGRAVLLFFGFTNCPDVCPLTMSKIDAALGQLDAGARDDVHVLFVTVDVARDTPEVLARYLEYFETPATGLTGTRAEVDAVVDAYRASYEIVDTGSAGGPTVSHTTYTYLIDPRGELRYVFRYADGPELIRQGLEHALAGGEAAA